MMNAVVIIMCFVCVSSCCLSKKELYEKCLKYQEMFDCRITHQSKVHPCIELDTCIRKSWIGKSIEEIHSHKIWTLNPGFRINYIWLNNKEVEVHVLVDCEFGWYRSIVLKYKYDEKKRDLILHTIFTNVRSQ